MSNLVETVNHLATGYKYLFVFFVSMVPLIELRGALPFAYIF